MRDEASLCEQQGIAFLSYPIQDRDVPQQMNEAKSVIDSFARYVTEGKHIAIHCRMGIGRSALIAAATLVALGETTERAFAMIREVRGYEVPDTAEQREWVERFSADIATESTG